MEENNEIQKIGYYSVIPTSILYNSELKPNQKLLYAMITSLANKEGYCYASNKYLANKLGVGANTVSGWITDLRRKNFIKVEILRNEKQEIIQRKIYINDMPYALNKGYPYTINEEEGILQKSKENNIINNTIPTHTLSKIQYKDRVFLYDYEYQYLIDEYSESKTNKAIEELSLYKKSKGVEYASDYDTIKRWVIARVEEIEIRKNKRKNQNKLKANFEQREYKEGELDYLYDN